MRRFRVLLAAAVFAVPFLSPLCPSAQDQTPSSDPKASPEAPGLSESYGKLSKKLKKAAKSAEAAKAAKSAELKRIQPGKDLQPQFSDPGRVQTILKLISDIYYGRPLPYPKDGTVFSNREGLLPAQPTGYYREYTVIPPPGSPLTLTIGDRTFQMQPPAHNRGAERLVIGAGDDAYYCPDHYKTFIRLTVVR